MEPEADRKAQLSDGLPVFQFPIEAGKVSEFARAVFETNPIFFDVDAARSAGLPGIPAPLTYGVVSRFFQRPENEVRHGLDMRWTLHGEQEFEYFRLPIAGETLTGQQRLGARWEKQGRRGGRLIFQEIETWFHDRDGQPVLRMRQVLVQTEPRGKMEAPDG